MISGLNKINDHASEKLGNGGNGGGLWFRIPSDNTEATTIDSIKRDLSLPSEHRNHRYMIDRIKTASGLHGDISVYFDEGESDDMDEIFESIKYHKNRKLIESGLRKLTKRFLKGKV